MDVNDREGANLVAQNVMGIRRYLNLVRQRVNYGDERIGLPQEEQGNKQTAMEEDTAVEPPSGPAGAQEIPRPSRRSDAPRGAHGPFPAPMTLQVQIDGFRREMNVAMFAGKYRNASDLQQQIFECLNLLRHKDFT